MSARRTYRAAEALGLLVALPAALAAFFAGRPVLPMLWIAALACAVALRGDRSFDGARAWRRHFPGHELRTILLRFGLGAAAMTALLAAWHPENLFILPRTRPLLWVLVILLYPLLSVIPQGVIYRAFVFHRYRSLLPSGWPAVVAAAAAFSFMHIVFRNGWAVGLTFIGGLIFARTYQRTASLWLSAIEHALYGCWVFTVGYGTFFFHGTTATVQPWLPGS